MQGKYAACSVAMEALQDRGKPPIRSMANGRSVADLKVLHTYTPGAVTNHASLTGMTLSSFSRMNV
jgi:hypothetical protein